jgi:eukaryotic-like serine/threonine-protein kinase
VIDRNTSRPQVPGHRVESVLGRGASGTVWQGRDAMGRAVAIKVPHELGWLADEEATRTEAHVLMAVRHEHLVTLRDVVTMADDRVALVFDLVTGASLGGTVGARGRLRPGETVTVVTPLCEAVEALHGAGGLHGDVSPSNVMLTAAGKPLLLDLGAARLAAGPVDAPVHGTPGFVAPEVRQGFAPTEASDVFSLGALAWFCLTGNGAPDTMLRLDADVIRSHVGAQLADVVGACIDPDPARRPSAAEAARLFYDAAPAEAVEVVVGADDASALTHRLREEARDEAALPENAPSKGRWSGALGRTRPTARRSTAPTEPVSSRRPTPRAAALGLAALGLALLLASLVVSARSSASARESEAAGASRSATQPVGATRSVSPPTTRPAASNPGPRGSAPGGPSPSPVTPKATTPDSAALVRRADAPRAAPQDLIQALSDRRAQALSELDGAGLTSVDHPSSPAHAADLAVIDQLRTHRVRWEGLALEVAQASLVSAEGTRAVVRARVDWTAYVAVSGDGRKPQPAEVGQVLDFTLVRGEEGWRLAAVSAPAT